MNSVNNSIFKGLVWTAVDKFGSLGIQFLVMIILARLLNPADFGMIGMLSLFMAVGSLLIDSGFSHALIQKEIVTKDDCSTVFFINILIGLLLFFVLYFSAPYIAIFFHTPKLLDLSRVLFLMFPVNSLYVVHLAKLTRNMEFKKIALISVISAIVSASVGIYSACIGLGVWSLVYQQLSMYFTRLVLYWTMSHVKIALKISRTTLCSMMGFSSKLLGTGLITTFFDNIYVFLVGRFYPLKATGYFNHAWQYGNMLPSLLTGIVSKTTYPMFCKQNSNIVEQRETIKRILNMSLFVSIPCMFAASVCAHSLFVFLFSEKWIHSVPLFQIICLYGAFLPLRVVNLDGIKAQGRGTIFFVLETIQRILVVLSILLTLRLGMEELLIARNVALLMSVVIDMYICGLYTKYSILDQLKCNWSVILSATLAGFATHVIGQMFIGTFAALLSQFLFFILVYIGLCFFFNNDILCYIVRRVH